MTIARAAIVATIVLAAVECKRSQRSAAPSTGTARDSADQVMYGARSVLAFNGLRRGDVGGDTVMAFDAATRFEFRGVRAQFTSTLGRPLSMLTATTGTYRIGGGVLETYGRSAIVSDTAGRRIDGAAVRYDVAANRLASDSEFVATAGARTLKGVGFSADPGLFNVKCLQRCTGSLGR
jgi:hypothetical protein